VPLASGPQYAGKTSLIRHLQLSRGEFTTIERRAALAHTLQATAISFVHALVEFLRDYNHCYPNTLDSVALDLMERIRTDRDSLNEEGMFFHCLVWFGSVALNEFVTCRCRSHYRIVAI
jgi:hypothetical protein